MSEETQRIAARSALARSEMGKTVMPSTPMASSHPCAGMIAVVNPKRAAS